MQKDYKIIKEMDGFTLISKLEKKWKQVEDGGALTSYECEAELYGYIDKDGNEIIPCDNWSEQEAEKQLAKLKGGKGIFGKLFGKK